MNSSRYYCEYGCQTAKKNPCYFLCEANREIHYLRCHRGDFFEKLRQEYITFMESVDYPLARLGNIF